MVSRSRAFVSPRDLAAAVDVSESSLKRWADAGRLQVVRTAGGHRRIPLAEAVRFVREARLAVVDPARLGLGELGGPVADERALTPETLEQMFREHRNREVERLLVRSYLAGISVAELCDGPIRVSMERMGSLYLEGPEGIAIEHHAVDACIQALTAIRQLTVPAQDAPVAAGGAVAADPYILPTLAVAVVLEEAGFRAINVGPNTPIEALEPVLKREGASLLWRSCSIDLSRRAMETEAGRIGRVIERLGCEAVVGGRTWSMPAGASAKLNAFGSLQELSGFVRAFASGSPLRAVSAR